MQSEPISRRSSPPSPRSNAWAPAWAWCSACISRWSWDWRWSASPSAWHSARWHPVLRLALANLHRPGAPTGAIALSLGLGLTVLVAVALIEANLNRQILERLPERAPTFFFIDIQPDQVAAFDQLIASTPGASGLERT